MEEEIKAVRIEIADVRALIFKLEDQWKALNSKLDAWVKAGLPGLDVAMTTPQNQPKMEK